MKESSTTMTNHEVDNRLSTLQKLVQNEALIETHPSLAGINSEAVQHRDGTIYYGTGLCTPTKLSLALPFDVLSMVLVSEKIRRDMKMKRIYHQIADTHAKSNKLLSGADIDRLAQNTREALLRMANNLGLENFEVILASEFDQAPEYQEIYRVLGTGKHDYVRREIADIEWYRQYRGLTLKVGWIIQSLETNLGFDERIFDREYTKEVGKDVSFIYLKAGRTFDKARPKASPYIHISSEQRLLLVRGEDVKLKLATAEKIWGDKRLGGAMGYFADIVRLYEKLIESLGRISLEDKIEAIIDKSTK